MSTLSKCKTVMGSVINSFCVAAKGGLKRVLVGDDVTYQYWLRWVWPVAKATLSNWECDKVQVI